MGFFEDNAGVFFLAVVLISGASGWIGSWIRELVRGSQLQGIGRPRV